MDNGNIATFNRDTDVDDDCIHGDKVDNGYFQLYNNTDTKSQQSSRWPSCSSCRRCVCQNLKVLVGVVVVLLLLFGMCLGFILLQEKIESLKRTVLHMKNEYDGYEVQWKQEIESLQKDMEKMKSESVAKENQFKKRLSHLERNVTKVAFSAYMRKGKLEPLNDTAVTVPFEAVTVNVGNHYDNDTSTFTCPVDGVYMFSFTIYSGNLHNTDRHEANARLNMNSTVISRAVCTNSNVLDRTRCTATSSLLHYCAAGSKVYVDADSSDNRIIGGYRHSIFSGYLLMTTQ